MSGYVQTILNAFSRMDIEKLRFHLKEEYSYEDAPKDVFLGELARVFQLFRYAGDRELSMHAGKGVGKNSPRCGYRLVGNHSRNYLDLIFETDGDDITNIYCCKRFKPEMKIRKLKYKYSLNIHEDEKVTFLQTPEYIEKLNAAMKAWDEIVTSPPRVLDFNSLCKWVDENAATYDMFEDKDPLKHPMKWSLFLLIYPELQGFKEYLLQYIDVIREANTFIDFIQTEEQLLEWLVKYEDIGTIAPHGLKYSFREKDGHYWWYYYNPIYFKDDVFTQAIRFLNYYQPKHDEMFEKYMVYTSEDTSVLYNYSDSKEDAESLYSLSYHLQKRAALEREGINVPFWINHGFSDN